MAGLDPEEMEEWRTIFNLFDVDGDQTVTAEELGIVLRSMGQNPTQQELMDMIGQCDMYFSVILILRMVECKL